MTTKSHGELTARIARGLKHEGYEVYHDHGGAEGDAGHIASYFGPKERASLLSFIDIAVVEHSSNRAVALIEIEETEDRPKTLLGDAFCVLMGDGVKYDDTHLLVGAWTTLIVVGVNRFLHAARAKYILDQLEKARAGMSTGNAAVGQVVIAGTPTHDKLPEHVQLLMTHAIKRSGLRS